MKNIAKYLCLITFSIIFLQIGSYAASIVLTNGVTIKGKLVARTNEEITIQDPDTKQYRVIKAVFVRDLILDPDEQNIQEKKVKGKDLKLRTGDTGESNLLYILQPSVGALPGIAYPVGKLGSKLNLGYGAHAFCDLQMPMNIKATFFKIRLGLSVGFMYHATKSTDASSSLSIIPIIAYTKFQFITDIGLRPYVKLGGGITPVFGGGSSFDPTLAAGLGLGYVNNKIPYLEFYFEAGMMMAFESVRGDFITASLGVAYRFGAPTIITAEKK
ncbi:MAG: hypothetical protein A2176_09405 [Spirochaetes bacterium RBG_13_51_14]|nr:MAG: hypothetical protein A2176_09405 [Spirochaetes bacterium RBG_13_51_14]